MNFLKLLRSRKTVFTVEDLKKILDTTNSSTIRNYLSRAKKKWLVEQVFYGIWKLSDKDIDIFELACKLNKKSYISFETVLKKQWAIFQYYETVFLASDKSIEKISLHTTFKTIKLKNNILLNPIWIEHKQTYSIASLERAICDRIYMSPKYYFDNLSGVNWEKIEEISQIYNKRVINEIKFLKQNYAQ